MSGPARACARAGLAGIVVYVAVDVALVFLRPQFSVLHSAESDYGSPGRYAWLMDANFVLRGALTLAILAALALAVPRLSRVPLALLAVWAVGSALLAFFPDDPAGTPATPSGRVHLALAGIAFVAVAVGTRLATRALRRDAAWRSFVVPLTVLSWGAILPGLLLGKSHLRVHSLGGLYEKLFLALELGWLLVAAARIALAPAEGRRLAPEASPRIA